MEKGTEWYDIPVEIWSKICSYLKPKDVIKLLSICKFFINTLEEEYKTSIKKITQKKEFLSFCSQIRKEVEDYEKIKLPFYSSQNVSEETIITRGIKSRKDNEIIFTLDKLPLIEENYYISGIQCDFFDRLYCRDSCLNRTEHILNNSTFYLQYDEFTISIAHTQDFDILREMLNIDKNFIPFTMTKGGIPITKNDDNKVVIRNYNSEDENINIDFVLKKKDNLLNPEQNFITYQFQDQATRTIPENKKLPFYFSHWISHIIVYSEPYYEGKIELHAIFSTVIQRNEYMTKKILTLEFPEDKSRRYKNYRIIKLKNIKSLTSLDSFHYNFQRIKGEEYIFPELYFPDAIVGTSVNISAISANCFTIHEGKITHPSMI